MNTIRQSLMKHKLAVFLTLLLLFGGAGGGYYYMNSKVAPASQEVTVAAGRGDVYATVAATVASLDHWGLAEGPDRSTIPQGELLNLADEAQSWVLSPDGTYARDLAPADTKLFSCHQFFMENPSLSGRGTAGAKDAPRLITAKDDDLSGAAAAR